MDRFDLPPLSFAALMIDLSHLNPAQREAVLRTEGHLLVLAGAGSGKTRVIVHRIAHLIDQGVPASGILAVTFTNKAAGEMRARVEKLVPRKLARDLTVGTFHAFGLELLRAEHARFGYPRQITVADTGDQLALVKRAMRLVRIDDRRFDARKVLTLISLAKGAGRQPGEPLRRPGEFAPFGEDYDLVAEAIFPRYEQALRAMAMVDFDDLIRLPIELLRQHEDLRAALHDRFRHILVDEYQDTNRAQLEFLKLLGLPRGNVCAVGDDDQAIYGFRGAEVRNILEFHLHFPGAAEVRLEQNYRSTGNILACANAVIRQNEDRKPKTLFTRSGPGEKVQVVACPDEESEARYVASQLRASIARGRRPGDHAILYRTNLQSRPFEEALRAEGIAYEVVGGTEFFDRREVKDLLAYLRVLTNPADEVSLLRIVNYPPRGIGDATLEKIRHRATAHGLPLVEALRRAGAGEWEEVEGAAPRIRAFVDLLDRYSRRLAEGERASTLARELMAEVDLEGAVRAQFVSADAAAARVATLHEIVRSLERYEAREGRRASLAQYLAQLALERREEERELPGHRVVLMTLHAAKGLEFPVVFLVGLEEDLLPHKGMQGAPPDLPEERRLCYVGITRARERLVITRAKTRMARGRPVQRPPSRFLADLPEEAIETIDLEEPTPESEERSRTFFSDLVALLERQAAGK